jgi:serine/threonine protein kinase
MTSVQGTAEYMAPEQLDIEQGVGPKADIWAFGATLVHMLSGSPPFAGSSMAKICMKVAVQRQQPELPWQVHSSPTLARLLQSCSAYEPKDRPTAAEALQLLGEAMAAAWLATASNKGGRAVRSSTNGLQEALAAGLTISSAGAPVNGSALQQDQPHRQQQQQQQQHPVVKHMAAPAPAPMALQQVPRVSDTAWMTTAAMQAYSTQPWAGMRTGQRMCRHAGARCSSLGLSGKGQPYLLLHRTNAAD